MRPGREPANERARPGPAQPNMLSALATRPAGVAEAKAEIRELAALVMEVESLLELVASCAEDVFAVVASGSVDGW